MVKLTQMPPFLDTPDKYLYNKRIKDSPVHDYRRRVSIIGLIISLIAALFLLIGLIPFLGWFNWFTTLPAAVLGLIINGIALARSQSRSRVALTGLIISAAVFAVSLIRLSIGGGIL